MISGRWFKKKRLIAMGVDAMSIVGVFAVVTEVVDNFPALKPAADCLQTSTVLTLLVIGTVVYGVVKNRPRSQFVSKINNRDVEVALHIGNMEEVDAAFVVPVNSEFDMHLNGSVGASKSVQAMIIGKHFGGDHQALQQRIATELKSKIYRTQKEGSRYKLGTTVKVDSDDKIHTFYFVVNSHKTCENRVAASGDGLSATLSGLWAYMSTNGAKESVAIPLLGTGNGRLSASREEVYKEIVRSFVASCSGKSYCDKLTIVVRDEDALKFGIDIDQLVEFLKLQTTYADFRDSTGPSIGKPTS